MGRSGGKEDPKQRADGSLGRTLAIKEGPNLASLGLLFANPCFKLLKVGFFRGDLR